eukprot:m.247431 g.247431  ORF g.247431 m.247431 type:complete len:232 (+) comp19496_c0_seq20:321-1016(+)
MNPTQKILFAFIVFFVFDDASATKVDFPGNAVRRNGIVASNAADIPQAVLDGQWTPLRASLLEACLLHNNESVLPGMGNTGHCFSDFNHVDCCTMLGRNVDNDNNGKVEGIAFTNALGTGIRAASLDGGESSSGSWCTCQLGADKMPPQDVCHVQFRAMIGFKLVWCPSETPSRAFKSFVLVADDGSLLASGTPVADNGFPSLRERTLNWHVVANGIYADACGAAFPAHSA